jgi:hypothetical protein
VYQLEQVLRRGEVFEPMHPEVAEGDILRQVVPHAISRRLRDEDLSPVRGSADAGGPIDVRVDVTNVSAVRLGRMETDPDAHGSTSGPQVPVDGLGSRDGRQHGAPAARERVAKAV